MSAEAVHSGQKDEEVEETVHSGQKEEEERERVDWQQPKLWRSWLFSDVGVDDDDDDDDVEDFKSVYNDAVVSEDILSSMSFLSTATFLVGEDLQSKTNDF